MTLETILAIIAFIFVIIGLLFLSMIHLFMIPKDVMERDTTRQRHLEGEQDRMEKDKLDPLMQDREQQRESPEIKQDPEGPSSPEIEDVPGPQPDVDREPGQTEDPQPDKDPAPRRA